MSWGGFSSLCYSGRIYYLFSILHQVPLVITSIVPLASSTAYSSIFSILRCLLPSVHGLRATSVDVIHSLVGSPIFQIGVRSAFGQIGYVRMPSRPMPPLRGITAFLAISRCVAAICVMLRSHFLATSRNCLGHYKPMGRIQFLRPPQFLLRWRVQARHTPSPRPRWIL
jgi:hypothetical protein